MVTGENIPEPDNCQWCQEARNCTTSVFIAQEILNPLPQPDQTIEDYYNNICKCGHQTIPSYNLGKDIPDYLPHTTLCREHTIRWMESIIKLKMKHNPEEYGEPIA